MIHDALRDSSERHPWVLPIVRAGKGKDALPDWLIDRVYIDWRDDKQYREHFDQLLQAIFRRHKPSREPAFPSKSASERKPRITLTIDADFEEFDEKHLELIRELLKYYLGTGITVREKKRG